MVIRRLVSITGLFATVLILTLSLPLLVPLAALMTLFPATRGALPTLGFLTAFLWCDVVGIVRFFWIALRYRSRSSQEFHNAVYRVQFWWVLALKNVAQFFFRLTFTEHNTQAMQGPPALFLPRHASIADTIIPLVFYAIPHGTTLRYVLKKELLWEPALDIGGNWLPNYFVDRSGDHSEAAIAGVTAMAADLSPDEGLMIFLEGTRFTPAKHAALTAKADEGSSLAAQLKRWPNLLPPRLGGGSAILSANTQHDIIFCAHKGFEQSSGFRTLLNGSWWHSDIHLGYWRVPFAELPTSAAEHESFLFTQWDRMQETIRGFP